MKSIKLLFFFFFISFILTAQETVISDVQLRSFSGLVESGDNYLFFSRKGSNETKGESDFALTFMDENLNVINDKTFSLSKYSDLAGGGINSTNVLMIFYDMMKRNVIFNMLDGEGNIVTSKNEEKVKRAFLMPEYYPNVFTHDDKFLVVRATREGKIGYSLTLLDNELNEVYKSTFAPEKKKMDVLDVHYLNGKIYLLRQTAAGKKFSNEIVCHDASNGDELYVYNLYDGEKSGYPTFLRVNPDEKIYTAGMYFEGEKTSNTDSDGFFYLSLDPEGNSVDYETHDWDEVRKFTKEKGTSVIWGGKSKMMVHDIVLKPDNSLSIIAEGFRKQNKKGVKDTWKYTLGDLSIFDFNSEGYFEEARKIIKPDQVLTVKSETPPKGLKMAMELKKNGYFPYKYHIEYNGKFYLVFSIIEKEKKALGLFAVGAKSYYFFPLESYGIEDAAKVKIREPTVSEGKKGTNKVAGFMSSLNRFDETVYDRDPPMGSNNAYYNYDAMSGVMWKEGKLVFTNYNIMDKTVRFWIEDVPFD